MGKRSKIFFNTAAFYVFAGILSASANDEADYRELWNSVKDYKGNNGQQYWSRGMFYLSGRIVKRDKCKAVKDFEKSKSLGFIFAGTFLEYIYSGSYKNISALEGNVDSLIDVADKKWQSYKYSNALKPHSEIYAIKDIYEYYKRAEFQGYVLNANLSFLSLMAYAREHKLNIEDESIDLKPVQILCPVREKIR